MSGELVHRLREPAGEPEGALVLLHGRATDENDLYPLLDALDPDRRLLGVTPGAPLTNQPPGGRHWYVIEQIGQPDEGTFVESMTATARFLDQLLRDRGIPPDKVVMGGFSQGAAVSLALTYGMGRPKVAGELAMSGFLPMVRGWKLDLRAKREVPAYVTHGVYDPVIPVAFGRRVRDALNDSGVPVTYREPRVQHSIDPELLPEMQAWVGHRTGIPTPQEEGPHSEI